MATKPPTRSWFGNGMTMGYEWTLQCSTNVRPEKPRTEWRFLASRILNSMGDSRTWYVWLPEGKGILLSLWDLTTKNMINIMAFYGDVYHIEKAVTYVTWGLDVRCCCDGYCCGWMLWWYTLWWWLWAVGSHVLQWCDFVGMFMRPHTVNVWEINVLHRSTMYMSFGNLHAWTPKHKTMIYLMWC